MWIKKLEKSVNSGCQLVDKATNFPIIHLLAGEIAFVKAEFYLIVL